MPRSLSSLVQLDQRDHRENKAQQDLKEDKESKHLWEHKENRDLKAYLEQTGQTQFFKSFRREMILMQALMVIQ